jgi:hypothetical protein
MSAWGREWTITRLFDTGIRAAGPSGGSGLNYNDNSLYILFSLPFIAFFLAIGIVVWAFKYLLSKNTPPNSENDLDR